MDDFIIRALAAGAAAATVCGVLGCFVVWRRMAYFGDSLAHSALLGIALGLQTGLHLTVAIALVCLAFAALLVWIQHAHPLATDTALGILAHSALAIGLVAISLSGRGNVDLHAFLFGDLLTVSGRQLLLLLAGDGITLALLLYFWQPLLLMTLSEEMALAEGARVLLLRLLLVALMTMMVALSIRIIGVLLITSLLILPAAAARLLAKSPEAMALLAALLGVLATCGGLWLSLQTDAPAAPAIVAAAAALFAAAAALAGILSIRKR